MSSNQSIFEHRVRSVLEFMQYLPRLSEDHAPFEMRIYRGQSSTQSLIPKLFDRYRQFGNVILNGIELISKPQQLMIKGKESYLLEQFQQKSIPFLTHVPETHLDWLALAQHFGLFTRLLDWTENPLTALFFAVNGLRQHNDEAVVWSLVGDVIENTGYNNVRGDKLLLSDLDNAVQGNVYIYRPKHITPRIIAQQAYFTIHGISDLSHMPLEERFVKNIGNYSFRITHKLTISYPDKEIVLQELNRLGIDHLSLFPDLDGLSRQLNTAVK